MLDVAPEQVPDAAHQQHQAEHRQAQAETVRQRRAHRQAPWRRGGRLLKATAEVGGVRLALPGEGEQRLPPLLVQRLAARPAQATAEAEDQALQVDVGQVATGRGALPK